MMKILFYIVISIVSFSTFSLELKVISGTKAEFSCDQNELSFCSTVNKSNVSTKLSVVNNAFSEASHVSKNLLINLPAQSKEQVSYYDLLDKVMSSKLIYFDMNSLVRYFAGKELEVAKNKLKMLCIDSKNPGIILEKVDGNVFPAFILCSKNVYLLNDIQKSVKVQNSLLPSENSFYEIWSEDYKPFLKIQCSERDTEICSNVCELDLSGTCYIPMKVCRDCIGTSLLVTDIFEGMGVRYKNTGKEIRFDEFVTFLRTGQFVTFSAKSVYNHVDNYDSLNLQMRFNGLCPFEPKNPAIVFFDLRPKSNVLNKVRYVACDQSVFEMDDKALIDNDGQLKKFKKQFIFSAF